MISLANEGRRAVLCTAGAAPYVLTIVTVLLPLAACGDMTVPLIGRSSFPATRDANFDVTAKPFDVRDGALPVSEGTLDAPTDAIDASLEAGEGSGPFGNPVLVGTTSGPLSDPSAEDQDPTFTADERELYFMSDRGTLNQDIWMSRRTDKGLLWDPPTRVDELSSTAGDHNPAISSLDGLTIWFSSNRDDTGNGLDIWVSTRPTRLDRWKPPERVLEVSSSGDDTGPAVDETELVMLLVSNRAGGPGARDIFLSTRQSRSDPWGTPTPLPGVVNSVDDDWDPFLGAHGLQIFWATNKDLDEEIRWSTRGAIDESFSTFAVLNELGKPSFDPTLSVDLRHIMFASARSGNNEIYEAYRP
jgi:hypothetical protein